MNIESNIKDLLLPFQKGYYYNSLMGGSFSIKSVLPAIFPNDKSLDYKNLEGVQNGSEAMYIFHDVIVNTTPIGMYPDVDKSPVDKKIFKNYDKACDLIYNPKKTRFLKDADSMNLKTENGLKMLIYQAIKSGGSRDAGKSSVPKRCLDLKKIKNSGQQSF